MDHKLARGHVRSELRLLARHSDVLKDADTASFEFLRRLAQGMSIKPDMVARAASEVAAVYSASPATIHLATTTSGRTLSRRKSQESVRAAVLCKDETIGQFVIECVDMQFTTSQFRHACGRLPVEISWHACERLLERRGAETEATKTIATDVLGLMGLASFFVPPALSLSHKRIALPLRGGLLLCTVEDTFHGRSTERMGFYGCTTFKYPHRPKHEGSFTPVMFDDPTTDKTLVLHVNSWIAPSDLRPAQYRLAKQLQAFADRHARVAAVLRLCTMFPYPSIINASDCFDEKHDTASFFPGLDEAIDLIMDPMAAAAMGNDGAPARRPMRATARIERAHAEEDAQEEASKRQKAFHSAVRASSAPKVGIPNGLPGLGGPPPRPMFQAAGRKVCTTRRSSSSLGRLIS